MAKCKKLALLCASLILTLGLGVTTGCFENDTSSTVDNSVSTTSSALASSEEASSVDSSMDSSVDSSIDSSVDSSEPDSSEPESSEPDSNEPESSVESTVEDSSVCDTHTGGTATCKTLARCETCGEEYGERNATNHESTEFLYPYNNDATHDVLYACCGEMKEESVACTGGTANCVVGAYCAVCGAEYSEINPEHHAKTAETGSWSPGEGEHEGYDVKVCDCGLVFESFDVTNEKVGEVVLSEERFSLLELVDDNFKTGVNIADIQYKDASVLDQYDTTDGTLPTSIFGTAFGEQDIKFVMKSADEAEHVGSIHVNVITDVITTFDEILDLNIDYAEGQPVAYFEGYYVLGNDIGAKENFLTDFAPTAYSRITLDGKGYSVTYSTNHASQGLFACFSGTIKDVTFNVYEYQDSYASAGLAQSLQNATLEDVTYNLLSASSTPHTYGMSGAMVHGNVEGTTFKNVTINIMGVDVASIFGASFGTEANEKANTFERVTIYVTAFGELANTANSREEATAITELPGVTVIKPQTLAMPAQEILLTGETYAISLGKSYADATVTAINYGKYDLGTNLSALHISESLKADKQAHGEQMLTVHATTANGAVILNVPVLFITMEIGDVATFQSTITTPAHSQAVYGYYVLTANIGTSVSNCILPVNKNISDWESNFNLGFQGSLDGKYFNVYSLGNTSWGIFTVLRNATVKNVHFSDGWYGGGHDQNANSFIGRAIFNTTMENITITQIGGMKTDGTGWFADGRVEGSTFKNVTVQSSATITKQIALFGTCFYAGDHKNACTFENFVIKGFTISYVGSNAHVNNGTIYVMNGQTVTGAQCVTVPGIRYAQ